MMIGVIICYALFNYLAIWLILNSFIYCDEKCNKFYDELNKQNASFLSFYASNIFFFAGKKSTNRGNYHGNGSKRCNGEREIRLGNFLSISLFLSFALLLAL